MRRSSMTLFSDPTCQYSHRVRIVLAEKGVTVDIEDIEANAVTEEILEANPYGTLPTLVDRDLALYESKVVMEYLDERFPHPPLMPVDPVSRSKSRLALFHIEKDWCAPVEKILHGTVVQQEKARKVLTDSMVSSLEIFEAKPYFLSDDFSLVDCTLAPLMWRLPLLGIEIPKQSKAIHEYCERVFSRESFISSLTEEELEMRPE